MEIKKYTEIRHYSWLATLKTYQHKLDKNETARKKDWKQNKMHTALVSHETSSGPSNNVIGVPGEEKLWGMMGIFMGFVHISEFTKLYT